MFPYMAYMDPMGVISLPIRLTFRRSGHGQTWDPWRQTHPLVVSSNLASGGKLPMSECSSLVTTDNSWIFQQVMFELKVNLAALKGSRILRGVETKQFLVYVHFIGLIQLIENPYAWIDHRDSPAVCLDELQQME